MPMRLVGLLCAAAAIAGLGQARAEMPASDKALGHSLGTVSFPVSCKAPAAKKIERGVAAMHHMTYSSARNLFEAAAKSDPDCAMAIWGIAMTYIHPLWSDRPSPEILEKGAELANRAGAVEGLNGREAGYVETVRAYFVEGGSGTEQERLKLFEAAWSKVSEANPDDMEAKAFYALAHLATAEPTDKSYAKQLRAGALAQEVLAAVPDHPGAHHYTIHAFDYPPLAERALPAAKNYGKIAPDVAHALHMTSHIYTRRGLWDDSIEWNGRAAEAALRLSDSIGGVSVHYPHALDYKGYAHLQKAQDAEARKIVQMLAALQPPFHTINQNAMAYALAAMPARYALERQTWREAANLQPRSPGNFPWAENQAQFVAMTHFARALGLAHEKRFEEANAEIAALVAIQERVAKYSAYWADQVETQRLAAAAWTAYLGGDKKKGLELMGEAAALEATTEKAAVSPGEILPAAELHGDMLLLEERYGDAAMAYETALIRSPRRFNSLYGAGRANALMGNPDKAKTYYAELVEICAGAGDERPKLAEARKYLQTN